MRNGEDVSWSAENRSSRCSSSSAWSRFCTQVGVELDRVTAAR
jgi:hypothetical protein